MQENQDKFFKEASVKMNKSGEHTFADLSKAYIEAELFAAGRPCTKVGAELFEKVGLTPFTVKLPLHSCKIYIKVSKQFVFSQQTNGIA